MRLEKQRDLEKSMEIDDSVRFKYELKSFTSEINQHNYLNHV